MPQRIVALDSVRGFLLIIMTLDHLGGPIAKYLYGAFGFISAAEGFFFLSGFVAIKVCLKKESCSQWLFKRMRKIWIWHILTLLVVTILTVSLSSFGWKILPGISHLFSDPILFTIGTLSLIHLPEYLDVLPLYVILMGMAAVILPMVQKTKNPAATLILISVILWSLSQIQNGIAPRSVWPVWMFPGAFNPLAWQLVFFSGAALALSSKRNPSWWQNSTILILSLLFILFLMLWKQGVLGISQLSETQFWNSRYSLGPLRIFNTALFVILLPSVIHKFPKSLDWRFPALLGRHSLYVYSFHLPLVYLWLFRPFIVGNALAIGIPIAIVISLAIPALLHEKS